MRRCPKSHLCGHQNSWIPRLSNQTDTRRLEAGFVGRPHWFYRDTSLERHSERRGGVGIAIIVRAVTVALGPTANLDLAWIRTGSATLRKSAGTTSSLQKWTTTMSSGPNYKVASLATRSYQEGFCDLCRVVPTRTLPVSASEQATTRELLGARPTTESRGPYNQLPVPLKPTVCRA